MVESEERGWLTVFGLVYDGSPIELSFLSDLDKQGDVQSNNGYYLSNGIGKC